MKSELAHSSSKGLQAKPSRLGGWLGAGLGLAAIVAVAFATHAAAQVGGELAAGNPAPRAVAQSVPDAAVQGVAGYLAAHAGQVEAAPDIARRAARDEAGANGAAPAYKAQVAPDAAAQGVAGYLAAHGAGLASVDRSFHTPQTSNYTPVDRAFHTPQTSNYRPGQVLAQTGPDAAVQGVLAYLRALGANVGQP